MFSCPCFIKRQYSQNTDCNLQPGFCYRIVCWLVLIVTLVQLDHIGKRNLNWRKGLDKIDLWPCLWGTVLVDIWSRMTQPSVGKAITDQVSLGSIGVGVGEQVSKPHSFRVSASVPAADFSFVFVSWFPSVLRCFLEVWAEYSISFLSGLFFIYLFFWSVFYHSQRKKI